ncbi:FadR/GntR family transcriptional regulator [Aeromicrobium sp. P5_D10]
MTEASTKVTSNDLRPAHTLSGYADVVDFIRREISLGRLMPGEKLPAERKLAEKLGVARETLRQAFRVLEGSGQIVIVRGTAGGAIIQDNHVAPEVALHELRQRRDTLLSLVEFRRELESIAARLSAGRRSDEDLAEMHLAQDALRKAHNKDESRRADTAFHLAVARAAGNFHLVTAIEDSRASMFHPVDLADYEFVKESSHSQHQLVLDQIAEGDGEAAAEAMRRHIDASRAEMLKLIDE